MKLYILYSKKMILAAMLKINYKGTRLEARGQQGGQSRRGMPVAWSLVGGVEGSNGGKIIITMMLTLGQFTSIIKQFGVFIHCLAFC